MKRRVVLLAVCLCSLMAWGQTDYYGHFQELLDKEDTVGLRTFIPEWEQKQGYRATHMPHGIIFWCSKERLLTFNSLQILLQLLAC